MSTFNDIATAVKTVIVGLGLGGSTIIRKEGSLQPRDFDADGGNYSMPTTVIWLKMDLGESWSALGNGTTDLGDVGRDVTIGIDRYRGNVNGNITDNLDDNPDEFQQIKRALNKGTLSGASTVWNTQLTTNALWEGMAFSTGGEMSHCEMTFCGAELRNG